MPEPASPSSDPRITHWRGFQLSAFQIKAIEAIRAGSNVLVSAPTGAGKTLVAEYAIADAVLRRRRCVYTAPIKALSNQKYRDFRDVPEMDVGLMTGDVTIRPEAQVLIMTTEILRNSIFEDPRALADVDYVIFDEVHFLDDAERGTVWEESIIFAPPQVRMIALSATISNLDQLGSWLREIRPQALEVVQSTTRPVPLKHRLHSTRRELFDAQRLQWVKKNAAQAAQRDQRRGRRGKRGSRPHMGLVPGDLDDLFEHLQKDELLPALCFSFSRKDCERLAHRNQNRRLLAPAESERMRGLSRELVRLFQLEPDETQSELFALAERGVGYHHAGMLPIHKEVVERLFTSGLIKLLFTTETFALGINMPARTVVFSSLRKFDGVSFDWLRTRDYLQMAGRAGRQGIDDAGLVITHLDERDLADAPIERLFSGKSEPVQSRFRLSYSSILHLSGHLGKERVFEAWDKSFDQYQQRAKSRKAREFHRQRNGEEVEAHLALLAELGYLEPDGRLTARGEVARLLYGYELVITELVFRGVLDRLAPKALAVAFVGLVHEERGRGPAEHVPARLHGNLRRAIDEVAEELLEREHAHGIRTPSKSPSWGLTSAIDAWYDGQSFEAIEELTPATPGEICRNFRMALQLMRSVRRTLGREAGGADQSLSERIDEVCERINREEVDARRQLALG
ncbi:MAG: DEAD/DEAH box helicase [Planctomycetes bacterium]|nr:DEAD/DEAH box helicase [Planctomycetota bacterium]